MTIDHYWSHMCLIVRIECQSYAESVSDEHDRVAKFNKNIFILTSPRWLFGNGVLLELLIPII